MRLEVPVSVRSFRLSPSLLPGPADAGRMFLLLLPVAIVVFGVAYDLFVRFIIHFNDDRAMPCIVMLAGPFALYGGIQAIVEAIGRPNGYKAFARGILFNLILMIVLGAAIAMIVSGENR
jgi:hypothetical protein